MGIQPGGQQRNLKMGNGEKRDTLEQPGDRIRQAMREKRHGLPPDERRLAGKAIAEKIQTPPVDLFLRTQMICIYLSTRHEIPTRYIARAAWQQDKVLCVPVWSREEKRYTLDLLTPRTRLITGKYGIREPAVHINVPVWEVNAFIVPGLAFDTQGGRLGYGSGYYDSLLRQASPSVISIGICYDWQVSETSLPQKAHDCRLSWLVTDKRAINCRTRRVPD